MRADICKEWGTGTDLGRLEGGKCWVRGGVRQWVWQDPIYPTGGGCVTRAVSAPHTTRGRRNSSIDLLVTLHRTKAYRPPVAFNVVNTWCLDFIRCH